MSTDIDDQLDKPRRSYTRNENGSSRRIAEALVIAALIGLGGSVWLLRESVAVLQASQAFLQKQIDRIDIRQERDSDKLNEIQGRVLRGLSKGEDPLYAPDKQ